MHKKTGISETSKSDLSQNILNSICWVSWAFTVYTEDYKYGR